MPLWLPQHTPTWKQGFASCAAEAANPGLWKGLVGAWMPALGPTGLTLRDISGHHNHGTLTNMNPGTDWVTTEKGWALRFAETSDVVTVGSGTKYCDGSQYYTAACWLRTTMTDLDHHWIYLYRGAGAGLFGGDINKFNAGELSFGYWATDNSFDRITSSGPWNDGEWHHVAMVATPLAGYLYIDGALRGTNGVGINSATYNELASIGGRSVQINYSAGSDLTNIAFWNRALSPNEIQHLYEDPHALVRPRARWFPAATAAPATTTSLISYKPQHTPTWKQGFARNAAESDNPGLWKGLAGAWMPSLGPTGLTIRDISGRKNHGTLTNMDPATDWVMTEKGYALDFDGTNDYVVGTPMSMLTGSQLTVSAWLYCRSDTEDQRAISRGGYSGPVILLWGDNQSGGGVQGLGNTDIYMFTSYLGSSNRVNGTTNSRIINTWQHVVGVMNGAYRGLYVDGSLNASHSSGVQQTLAVTADNLWFGDWQAASLPANMRLGPVSIHNRVLSPNEIQHLYQDPHALVRPRARWFPAAAAVAANAPTGHLYGSLVGSLGGPI